MTFGTEWGWGTPRDECRRILDAYVEAGGNFVDTANFYTGGTSELFLGEFVSGRREQLVIASKYALAMRPGDANSGGSHAEQMQRLDDASRIEPGYPHDYLRSATVTRFLYGGAKIE
jgi:aryl-alcohol dehydrogenase-like predicted oxidoreductase